MKISVVIPVYNAEKYLAQCIDSVLNQTIQDFEIIAVDDGSTDQSYEILQNYKSANHKIKVFQQKNQYAGVARNKGIAEAEGDYLVFIDSDDFIEPDYLEQLYDRITLMQADICICEVDNYHMDSDTYSPGNFISYRQIPRKDVFNSKDLKDRLLTFLISSPCNKMISRQFLKSNQILFQETFHSNDIYFSQICLAMADRITVLNTKALYHYRLGLTGNIQSGKNKHCMDGPSAVQKLYDELCRRQLFKDDIRISFQNYAISILTWFLKQAYGDDTALLSIYNWMMGTEILEDIEYKELTPHALFAYRLFLTKKETVADVTAIRRKLDRYKSGNSSKSKKTCALVSNCIALGIPFYPIQYVLKHRGQ